MISSHDTVPWCIEVGEGEGGDTVKRIADNNGLKNHNKGACQPRGRRYGWRPGHDFTKEI